MSKIAEILHKDSDAILDEWIKEQLAAVRRRDLIDDAELKRQCSDILSLMAEAVRGGNITDIDAPGWNGVKEKLSDISASRARQGLTASETAIFVFSLKRPLFTALRKELARDSNALFDEIWRATLLIDRLGLSTTESFLTTKEELIVQQQEEMLELLTPVVKLWDGILAIPLIGTLDSNRTQVVMESLLSTIVATNSRVAIIDITGVPAVDTLVAQHLLKTITAARLMGAECILSGIRPQIAQTIVHLGINLQDVITKPTMADALAIALQKTGRLIVRADKLKQKAGENTDGAEPKERQERKGA